MWKCWTNTLDPCASSTLFSTLRRLTSSLMSSSLGGRCRWEITECEIWNAENRIWNTEYRLQLHFLMALPTQETSKKAVLSQIEQADKFQEVSSLPLCSSEKSRSVFFLGQIYTPEREKRYTIPFQEEIVELALKDIGLIWISQKEELSWTPPISMDQHLSSPPFQIVNGGSYSMWSTKFSWEISHCDTIS